MRTAIFIILAVAGILWATAGIVKAHHLQPVCEPTEAIRSILKANYGETREVIGLHGEVMFEMWLNNETGSWSILLTGANGTSCLVLAGEAFTYDMTGEGL